MLKIETRLRRPDHVNSILFEPGLCSKWRGEVGERLPAATYLVMVDANLARNGMAPPSGAIEGKWRYLWVEPGEQRKNLTQYAELCESALGLGIDRKTVVVAIGGGVTGDIAGFVASTLLRGLRLAQIPTTLLSQVDSSVGGKNGVNSRTGKNLIGTFLQPDLVLIDPMFLDTLPRREYQAGVTEIVKTAVLDGLDFVQDLQRSTELLKTCNHGYISGAIARCCRVKTDFVMSDERDTGRRNLLNLGHTFGHVMETLAGYDGKVVHGEAVAVGMTLACDFAVAQGMLPGPEAREVRDLLVELGLPTEIDDLGKSGGEAPAWKTLLASLEAEAALFLDKKSDEGKVNLVLPHAIGDCRLEKGFLVRDILDFMRSKCK